MSHRQLVGHLLLALILCVCAVGCSNLPRDPEKTLQHVKAMWIEDTLSLIPSSAFLIGTYFRKKPPDEQFPYDYRRAVLIAFLAGALALFGFSRNRKATTNAVVSGAGILALSLMTKYPLGAVKLVSFPTHGVIETAAGVATATAPWLMGFSRNRSARWTHLLSGLGTLMVVAMTDYRAAEESDS